MMSVPGSHSRKDFKVVCYDSGHPVDLDGDDDNSETLFNNIPVQLHSIFAN